MRDCVTMALSAHWNASNRRGSTLLQSGLRFLMHTEFC